MTQNKNSKTQWFQEARFGLFVHWGLYAVPGGEWKGETMNYIGEWIQSRFRIPNAEYAELTKQFNPVEFDADAWVLLAKRAGMRYVVFTAKHHDGFAMYDSAVDGFNIVATTPYGRDPLKQLAEACQKHGLKLGLYYSQDLDWSHPNGGDPGPESATNYGMSWGNDWEYPDVSKKQFSRYFYEKSIPQVRELLTNYGPIALMWFDCAINVTDEDSERLLTMVHELQPDCLVNSRVGNGYGDFSTMGDNQVPFNKIEGVWECAATINDTWGFKFSDQDWKSEAETLSILVGLASRGVNYLLNIGPQPDGAFPKPAVQLLETLGKWMDVNSIAIHGSSESPFNNAFEWGWVTSRPSTVKEKARLFFIFPEMPGRDIVLRGLKSKVQSIGYLETGRTVNFSQSTQGDCPVLVLHLTGETSGSTFPVLLVELEGEIEVDERLLPQDGGDITLPSGLGTFIKVQNESAEEVLTENTEFLGAAGEVTRVTAEPSVAGSGFVVNWLSARDAMQWEFTILRPGLYDVEIVSANPHHSFPWEGGHQISLEISGQTLDATLAADEMVTTPDARYYYRAISRVGSLNIETAGPQQAVLKAPGINTTSGVGLSLVHVRLRPHAA